MKFNRKGRECFKVYGYTIVKGNKSCNEEFQNYSSSHPDEKIIGIGRWFGNASGTLWIDKKDKILVKSIIYDTKLFGMCEINLG